MSNSVPSDAPKPRLCHVKKWSDFNGYGFNLHAEKGKAGQFIGKVDPGSPSEAAGLKEGDRIVEVNGTNIGNENHSQVVQRVKAVANETKLLVVDNKTDEYFKEQKIVVRGDMPYVEILECPDEKPSNNKSKAEENAYDDTVVVDSQDEDEPEYGIVSHESEDEDDDDEVIDFSEVNEAAAAAVNNSSDVADGPAPRQCHMIIWPDFQGYGFNLHAEKGKPGQFIGKVDPNSPADAAGLKQGDRIVEVNGEFIGEDNHGQVVQKIKSDDTRTTMLVVDEDAENYYRQKGVRVSSTMPNVKNIHCPASKAEFMAAASNNDAQSSTASETGPAPRLCHVRIWPDYAGYGFNLQSKQGPGTQFISAVEPGSPAAAAGLRAGDRIMEVNGQSTKDKDHGQSVQIIKSDPTHTSLLVVDDEAFDYYKARGVRAHSGMNNVEKIECPSSSTAGQAAASAPTPAPVVAAAAPTPAASSGPEPAPRLCHLKVWQDFKGYGFNLHAEKERGKGQYIGKVDAGSPAEAAGVREQDKIIEVNGRSMVNEDHRSVVAEVKADPTQVKLLVVDAATYDYYKSRDVVINSGMANVERITCPDQKGGLANGTATAAVVAASETKAEVNSISETNGAPSSEVSVEEVKQEEQAPVAVAVAVVDVNENEPVKPAEPEPEPISEQELDELQDYEVVERREPEPEPVPEPKSSQPDPKVQEPEPVKAAVNDNRVSTTSDAPIYEEPTTPVTPVSPVSPVDGMFAGSAKEMRERLSKKSSRKHEVKKQDGVSMRDKFELFQKL